MEMGIWKWAAREADQESAVTSLKLLSRPDQTASVDADRRRGMIEHFRGAFAGHWGDQGHAVATFLGSSEPVNIDVAVIEVPMPYA
jgi:hypothetical protein